MTGDSTLKMGDYYLHSLVFNGHVNGCGCQAVAFFFFSLSLQWFSF